MLMNPYHQATPYAVRTHYDLETLTSLQLLTTLGALGSTGGLLGKEVWRKWMSVTDERGCDAVGLAYSGECWEARHPVRW